jgi:1-phosphofructokinase family hexose kinase
LVLTVTPNAALDKTYLLDRFTIDRVHRPREVRALAGGKGVNVARTMRTLGGNAVATGFLGGNTGRDVRENLATDGIPDAFVEVVGETRLCLAIIDTSARTQTEINENGPDVSAASQERFRARFESLLAEAAWVAFCGSLPPGVPPEFYRDLIALAREHGVRTALDASGDALRLGMEAAPDLVKPNAVEVSVLLGRDIETVGEAADAGRELLEMGVGIAAITLGRCGAVAVDQAGAWYAEPPQVEFQSAVGSGDAFLAGLLHTLEEGRLSENALRWATAAGAANAKTYGAGVVSKPAVEEIAARVVVAPI